MTAPERKSGNVWKVIVNTVPTYGLVEKYYKEKYFFVTHSLTVQACCYVVHVIYTLRYQ